MEVQDLPMKWDFSKWDLFTRNIWKTPSENSNLEPQNGWFVQAFFLFFRGVPTHWKETPFAGILKIPAGFLWFRSYFSKAKILGSSNLDLASSNQSGLATNCMILAK